MKLSTKKWIDETLGFLILCFLNGIARALGSILRRNHSSQPIQVALVLKFQGMGSLVIAKPALHAFKQRHPHSKIVFFGTPSTTALARLMPEFDEILELDDSSLRAATLSTIRALRRLQELRVDWAFDLEVYSNISSVLATLSCARNRAGFVVNNVRHRRFSFTHLIFFNRYEYLGTAYDRLLSVVEANRSPRVTDLTTYGNWKISVDRIATLPSRYCVMNIHAGDLALERRWPREHFASLAQLLRHRHPELELVLVGYGKSEIENCRLLTSESDVPFIDLSGKLSLQQTIACLAFAELVISNDTAPLHLALASATKVLALFGPTRAATYFPPGRINAASISKSIYCSPCVHHWEPPPCGGDNQCMKSMGPTEVMSICEKLLSTNGLINHTETPADVKDFYPGLVYSRKVREWRRLK